MWNVILNTIKDNVVVPSENNPTESGNYVCTCVAKFPLFQYHKYLKVMTFDAEENRWHLPENKYGTIPILAWTKINPCDFDDFDYRYGYLFEKENN